jgi:predicted 3-demethylubiquinone-9 3-methyltransferase (glyoxalase superfamily)
MSEPQHSVSTCLVFDREAEDAATFYTALIPNSEITHVSRYGAGGPLPEGTALMVEFTLDGRRFQALNGQKATPNFAMSLSVRCETQDEVDRLWAALTADGGAEVQCGWLTDRWGFPWQIVPAQMETILSSPDREGVKRAFAAMMTMKKLDIAVLQAAFRGE